MKKILVPIDFTDGSIKALDYATFLAGALSATLHLLHVVEKPHLAVGGTPFLSFSSPELVDRLVRAADERMTALASARAPALQVEQASCVGVPYTEIVRYASENDIDVIVIGTHGRGEFTHLLLGSVAERVVRTAPCPVMTVRQPSADVYLV